LNQGRKHWVLAIVAVDALFVVAAIWWFTARVHRSATPAERPPSADVRVEVRRVRPKLMEIDLVNHGNAKGAMNRNISVSWADADLVDSQALTGFERTETGRHSVQFQPGDTASQNSLAAGAVEKVGWIQLTDDSPMQAEFTDHSIKP
jgi:hypothetical protein